jgi:hypothetical protein
MTNTIVDDKVEAEQLEQSPCVRARPVTLTIMLLPSLASAQCHMNDELCVTINHVNPTHDRRHLSNKRVLIRPSV